MRLCRIGSAILSKTQKLHHHAVMYLDKLNQETATDQNFSVSIRVLLRIKIGCEPYAKLLVIHATFCDCNI